ncbi:hypothetical protein C8R43DRAFT_959120 [Mycena crocata]|nr:hypothetical protein C8R43DRAFT_959120 [Mycena crocata]
MKMFTQIFLLGLSAFVLVGAGPTTMLSSSEARALDSGMPPGRLYQISQHAGPGPYDDNYLRLPWTGEGNPLVVAPLTGHEQYVPMWWVKQIGEDQFQMQFYGYEGVLAAAPSARAHKSQLVISSADPTLMSVWAIERAGGNVWTIKAPYQDLVWKRNENSTLQKEIQMYQLSERDGLSQYRKLFGVYK